MPSRRRVSARAVALVALALSLLVTVTVGGSAQAVDPVDPVTNDAQDRGTMREKFLPGDPYTGNYPDPSVSHVDGRYVTTGTSTSGKVLPLMTSSDLITFTPRHLLSDEENVTGWATNNDAMAAVPSWPLSRSWSGRPRISIWAPSTILRIGTRYLIAYSSARQAGDSRNSCIGLAWADQLTGPYVDEANRPVVCYPPSRLGAIDPDLYRESDGSLWLLWKQEGVGGSAARPPTLMSQRLRSDGRGLQPGTTRSPLLVRDRAWERGVVENPSMLRHRGKLYLFYSGGHWFEDSYGTGYAVCERVTGPCTKLSTAGPLLGSDALRKGPGGADAVLDHHGRVRLVYAAWDAGRVGLGGTYPRRMHVATLATAVPRAVKRPTKPKALRKGWARKAAKRGMKRAKIRRTVRRATRTWKQARVRYRATVRIEASRLQVTARVSRPWVAPGPLQRSPDS